MMAWILRRRRHLTDELLSAYVDGSLDAAETRKVDSHLETCEDDCAIRLEGLRATISVLRSVSTAPAPRSFALSPQQVYQPARQPEPARRRSPVPVLAPAFAATAAAVVFGVLLAANITGAIEQSGDMASREAVTVSGDREVVQSLAREEAQGPAAPPGSPGEPETDVAQMEAAAAPAEAEQEVTGKPVVETVVIEKEKVVEKEVAVTQEVEKQVPAGETTEMGVAQEEATATPTPAMESAESGFGVASTDEEGVTPKPEATATPEEALAAAGAEATGTPRPEPTSAPAPTTPAEAPEQAPADGESEVFFNGGEEREAAPADSTQLAATAEDGITLPVWQLQVLFGALAVLFSGLAAILLRRRSGAST